MFGSSPGFDCFWRAWSKILSLFFLVSLACRALRATVRTASNESPGHLSFSSERIHGSSAARELKETLQQPLSNRKTSVWPVTKFFVALLRVQCNMQLGFLRGCVSLMNRTKKLKPTQIYRRIIWFIPTCLPAKAVGHRAQNNTKIHALTDSALTRMLENRACAKRTRMSQAHATNLLADYCAVCHCRCHCLHRTIELSHG